MAKKNLVAVVINQKNKFYKLNTVSVSNDGSIHIIINPGLLTNRDQLPVKGTYHTSGLKHFTQGSGEHRQEIFPKKQSSHPEIEDSQGLMNYTIKDLDKKELENLGEFTKFNKYRKVIVLDAKDYVHLTIQYFLATKNFDISRSARFYNEVFEVELDNHKILIATRNSKNIEGIIDVYLGRSR